MKAKFITTPIYYVNDVPHLGHAFTTICADYMARYYRLKEYDVFFLVGSDEHGKKIEDSAKKSNMNSQEFVDSIVKEFKNKWKILDISYDRFIRTTDKDHEEFVKNAFNTFYNNGDLYKGHYEGKYCVSCEAYYGDDEIINNLCPIHKKDLTLMKEETYFFKLSKYEDKIRQLFEQDDFIIPKKYKNEMLNKIKSGLKDVSVSRTNLDWGIRLPFDNKHVVYVWYDALLNYLSGMNDKKYWPATHILGKEILWFHSVYWPAMLISLGYKEPKILVHGWWTVDNEKMSKTLGNVVSIDKLTKYGVDVARFFLIRQMAYGEDSDFNKNMFEERYNELLNSYSNLVYRISSFCEKNNFDLTKKEINPEIKKKIDEIDSLVFDSIEEFRLQDAINHIMSYANYLNKYVSDNEPWILIKSNREKSKDIIFDVIYGIEYLNLLLEPIVPSLSLKTKEIFSFKSKTFREFMERNYISYEKPKPKMLITKVDLFDFK